MYFKKVFLSMSIKNKIFFLNSIVILGCIITIAIFSNSVLKDAIIKKEIANSSRELELIGNSLRILFEDVEEYSKILSTEENLQQQLTTIKTGSMNNIELLGLKREVVKSISKVLYPNTKIIGAVALDITGRIINNDSVYSIDTIYDIADRDTLRMVSNIQVPVWLGLHRLEIYSGIIEDCFVLAKRVTNVETGSDIGTVLLFLNEDDVASIFTNSININENKIYVLDERNIVLSAQDKSLVYKDFGALSTIDANALRYMKSKTYTINGKLFLAAVQDFWKLDWYVVQLKSLDALISENRKITDLITMIGAVCLVVAFAIAYFLSNVITKPLLKLSRKMDEITGDHMELFNEPVLENEIGFLASGYNRLVTRIKLLMDDIYAQQRAKRRYEFRILQSQINPHFLYNTIETISSFIKLGMDKDAIEMGNYLADFYRYSLSNGKDIITVGEEIKLIENYLLIQKKRYVNVFDYSIQIDSALAGYKVLKLTLQPLVENAIYHGLKPKRQKGWISITGYVSEDKHLVFEVSDNGVGISEDKIREIFSDRMEDDKSEGFGLYSVNQRLRLVYGEMYGLSIESRIDEYTKVSVRLPLN